MQRLIHDETREISLAELQDVKMNVTEDLLKAGKQLSASLQKLLKQGNVSQNEA